MPDPKVTEHTLAYRVRHGVASRQEAESYVSAAEQAFHNLRQAEQTARQDERRKVLRKVAQWHNDQAKGYENSGGGPQALNHRKYARHFVALAEEVT